MIIWGTVELVSEETGVLRLHIDLETFRFQDEDDDYEWEIWLQVFSRILKIYTPRKASFYHFSLEKLARLPLVKEVTPSTDRKMIKLLTFDNFR